jgi:uncharacterized protein YidB (DUF937 family)
MDLNTLMKLASNPQIRQLVMSLIGQMGQGGGGKSLAGLVDNMQGAGLQDQVKSWVGTGDNQPVSGQQLTEAIGTDKLHNAAQAAGMTDQAAADSLAKVLPQVVDTATPAGKAAAPADFEKLLSQLFSGGGQGAR